MATKVMLVHILYVEEEKNYFDVANNAVVVPQFLKSVALAE